MSAAISSAQPFKLFRYSDVTTGIDRDLVSEANWLGDLLRNFEARCTEYPVRVSHLADSLRDHARTAESVDRWVHSVGQGFERADRGYAATWGLRGQGVLSAQAVAFIDRLAVSGAFAQRWSLALQIFKTKWALNEAILRLRYQVFMLKYAPWFDRARLPWDLYEKYQSLLAGALIASSIRFGHAYSGQIIINLPDFLRNFGFSLREVRTWAGLSGHLTHIKYTNLPSHMFWASLALSIPSLVSRWSSDIIDYGSGEYTGTELASALTVDTALTLAPVATTYVGAKAGMIIGAAIGTAVAPGIGTAVGGAVGAIAGGVIASWATKEVIERTDIREKAIPWLDEHVFGPVARTITSGVNAVSGWVDEAGSRLRQKLQDTADAANRVIHDKAIKPISGEALELRQSLHDAMDGWGTDEAAIMRLIKGASDAEKSAILNDTALLERLDRELSKQELLQAAKEFVDVSNLPPGSIQDTVALLAVSPSAIEQNTARLFLEGRLKAYYIEDLRQPNDVDKLLEEAGYDHSQYTLYLKPPDNAKLMLVQVGAGAFADGNAVFVSRTPSPKWLDTLFRLLSQQSTDSKTIFIHEASHALNPVDTSTPLGYFESEFLAYWVAGFEAITDPAKRAQRIKDHILTSYPHIKEAYDTDPEVRRAIDAYTRPKGTLINAI